MSSSIETRARELASTGRWLDDMAPAVESLRFCRQVYVQYAELGREPNEHMDQPRALAQLLESVDRLLATASSRQ